MTHFHVVPVAEDFSGGPASVAARLHHIMTDHVWRTLAVHPESQADFKRFVVLQINIKYTKKPTEMLKSVVLALVFQEIYLNPCQSFMLQWFAALLFKLKDQSFG